MDTVSSVSEDVSCERANVLDVWEQNALLRTFEHWSQTSMNSVHAKVILYEGDCTQEKTMEVTVLSSKREWSARQLIRMMRPPSIFHIPPAMSSLVEEHWLIGQSVTCRG